MSDALRMCVSFQPHTSVHMFSITCVYMDLANGFLMRLSACLKTTKIKPLFISDVDAGKHEYRLHKIKLISCVYVFIFITQFSTDTHRNAHYTHTHTHTHS